MAKKFNNIVNAIQTVLKDNPATIYPTEAAFVQAVLAKYPNIANVRVRNCVRWLVTGDYVRGETNPRNDEVTGIKYKPSDTETIEKLTKDVEHFKEQAAKAGGTRIVEVQIKDGRKKVKSIKASFHKEFETLVDLAKMRANIFIYGPTGCGKTFVCEQLAEALNLPFSFISCTAAMSEGQVGGRLIPTIPSQDRMVATYKALKAKKIDSQAAATMASSMESGFNYVLSEFVDRYENGGVFLFDEFDAADANVLLLVNSALANGFMSLPNRPDNPIAKRHKDFICIAAANTVGTGADRLYAGRNQLDAATLDRFLIGKVFMDYDEQVEQQLCPDIDLLTELWAIRAKIRTHNLERAMSSRFIKDAAMMKEAGWSHEKILKAFFQGWTGPEMRKVQS